MSDPLPHIATIQHLYTGPTGTNIFDATIPTFTKLIDSRGNEVKQTFGSGNVAFSLPKVGECIHGSSKFLCGCCFTIADSTQESSEKKGPSSSRPLSQSGISGMYSFLRPQSRAELSSVVPDETKLSGPHTPLSRTVSFSHQH